MPSSDVGGRGARSASGGRHETPAPDPTLTHFYPEVRAGGFSRVDGTVEFFTRVNALLRPDQVVVDFGAGRGEFVEDSVPFRRDLRILRGKVAKVVGVDLDPAVLENPSCDETHLLGPGGEIPLPDASVDVVVTDNTLEHVADPARVVSELQRVVKPGGWVCARTPNKWGYIGLGARMVPNQLHVRFLTRLQPERQAEDVFPVVYRMNTRRALRRAFPPDAWELSAYAATSEPAYVGSSRLAWRVMTAILPRLPRPLGATWLVFAQKK